MKVLHIAVVVISITVAIAGAAYAQQEAATMVVLSSSTKVVSAVPILPRDPAQDLATARAIRDFAARAGVRPDDPRIVVEAFTDNGNGSYYARIRLDGSEKICEYNMETIYLGAVRRIVIREVNYASREERYRVYNDIIDAYGTILKQTKTGDRLNPNTGSLIESYVNTYTFNDYGILTGRTIFSKSFDAQGRVISQHWRTATVIDAYGKVREEAFTGQRISYAGSVSFVCEDYAATYIYDQNGKLSEIHKASDLYNAQGQLTETYTANYAYENGVLTTGVVEGQRFDSMGRLSEIYTAHHIYRDGALTDRWIEGQRFDAQGRLTETYLAYYGYVNGVLAGRSTVGQRFDASGNMVEEYDRRATVIDANGVVREENLTGRRMSFILRDGMVITNTTEIYAATYIYDQAGKLSEMHKTSDLYNSQDILTETNTAHYTYASGVLTARTIEGQRFDVHGLMIEQYERHATAIDGAGRVREEASTGQRISYVAGEGAQYVSEAYAVTYIYDQAGKLTELHKTADQFNPQGSLIGRYAAGYQYSYTNGVLTDVVIGYQRFDAQGRLAEAYTMKQAYNEYGYLLSRVTEGLKYDAQGRVIEQYQRQATSIDAYGKVREEVYSGQRISYAGSTPFVSETYTIDYAYGEDGRLTARTVEGQRYDTQGRMVEQYERRATSIDVYGKVREDVTTGVVLDSHGGPIAEYVTVTGYNDFGRLESQDSEITILSGGYTGPVTLRVRYDINADGAVVYTHVYNESGQEIPSLGGSGNIQPRTIVIRFVGPENPKERKAQDPAVRYADKIKPADTAQVKGDAEVLERKAIEEISLQKMKDITFTQEMITEKKKAEIFPLKMGQ